MTNPENVEHGINPGVIRNTVLGIIALTVAVLDFTIGTRNGIIGGVGTLIVAAYGFVGAHSLRHTVKGAGGERRRARNLGIAARFAVLRVAAAVLFVSLTGN